MSDIVAKKGRLVLSTLAFSDRQLCSDDVIRLYTNAADRRTSLKDFLVYQSHSSQKMQIIIFFK